MTQEELIRISTIASQVETPEKLVGVLKNEGFNTTYLKPSDKYNPNETIEKEDSTIDDLYLVRATDCFSSDNVMQAPSRGQVLSIINLPGQFFKLKKYVDNSPQYTQLEEREKYILIDKLIKRVSPLRRDYRGSKHFTINSAVADNDGGSWDKMPYVYLEPIKPHLEGNDLENIAIHDTWFRGDVKLLNPTLLIRQKHLVELLKLNNPQITERLLNTEIMIPDETLSLREYVGYILGEVKKAPVYKTEDKFGKYPDGDKAHEELQRIREEKKIYGVTKHKGSNFANFDFLFRYKYSAEDWYRYILFVRENPKFNLTEEQKAIIDDGIKQYHELLEEAVQEDIPIDFDETKAPRPVRDGDMTSDRINPTFNDAFRLFVKLDTLMEDTFKKSKIINNIDIETLYNENQKYNKEFTELVKQGYEHLWADTFKFQLNKSESEFTF